MRCMSKTWQVTVSNLISLLFFFCQILVPIANGSEEMEAVIIIDVLRRAKAEVVVASVEDKLEILASRKVKLAADVLLDEVIDRSYDLIVLPVRQGTVVKLFAFFKNM